MSDTSSIRVYVVDDHPVLREGLARALSCEPGLSVVGTAGTGADTLRDVPSLLPDVVLLDLNLPDRDGIELLAALRGQVPSAKLLVLSHYDDEFRVAEALRAGAQGYLVKSTELSELIDGIRAVARGGAPLSQSIAGAVVRAMREPAPKLMPGLDALTPRERQILRLLETGISTRETSQRLGISPKTLETHLIRIYQKLGAFKKGGGSGTPPPSSAAGAVVIPFPKKPPSPAFAEAEIEPPSSERPLKN